MAPRLLGLVPNVLSGLRLLLACGFWAVPAEWRLAAVVLGGASDWLDGLIARRAQVTSVAGGLLDGIADKALTLSVLLVLAADGTIRWGQVGLVLARDLVVGGVALHAVSIGRLDAFRHMPARRAGKLTTVAVFAWFVALLIPLPDVIAWPMFGAAAIASVWAAADYGRDFRRRAPAVRAARPDGGR